MQHKSLTVIAARHSIFDIQHTEPGVEGIIFGVTLNNVTPPNIFLLDPNFDKCIVKLYYFHIFSMFAKF